MARGSLPTAKCKGCVVDDTRGPPTCFAGVRHQMLSLSGISKVKLQVNQSVVSGYFMCLPYGLRDMCMTRLGLLTLNGYGSEVVNILIGCMCNIGWCIVGRQAIWWEGMLALDLHKMGPLVLPNASPP